MNFKDTGAMFCLIAAIPVGVRWIAAVLCANSAAAAGAGKSRNARPFAGPVLLDGRLSTEPGSENKEENSQDDPTPLTDEEFAEYQKKEKRKVSIIGDIVDFIINFFR